MVAVVSVVSQRMSTEEVAMRMRMSFAAVTAGEAPSVTVMVLMAVAAWPKAKVWFAAELIVVPAGKVQHVFPVESTEVLSFAVTVEPSHALLSFTSTYETDGEPEVTRYHGEPADEERSHVRVVALPPSIESVGKVYRLPARNCAEVEAAMVYVPVVEALAPKMTDWLESPAPLVFCIVRFPKAEVPVMVPESVCWDEPLSVVVPEFAVNVPEFV